MSERSHRRVNTRELERLAICKRTVVARVMPEDLVADHGAPRPVFAKTVLQTDAPMIVRAEMRMADVVDRRQKEWDHRKCAKNI
jgi:hypothetical protein